MTEVKKDKCLNVYEAICEVMHRLAKQGISKDRNNSQQNYKFRGIDDVYNALSTILGDVGLLICPIAESREVVERTTKFGGAIFYTTLKVNFRVYAKDGSFIEATTYGEAMDSADKSTNKAMSAAYKYLCLQLFCIPTEGDNDADATTHEVLPKTQAAKQVIAKTATTEKPILSKEAVQNAAKTFKTEKELTDFWNEHVAPFADYKADKTIISHFAAAKKEILAAEALRAG